MVRSSTEHMTLKDEPSDFERRGIANPQVDGTLMAHLVSEKIVWVMDLCSSTRDKDHSELFVSFCEVNNLASRRRASQACHGGGAPTSPAEAVMAAN
jgi:hypothetical protein